MVRECRSRSSHLALTIARRTFGRTLRTSRTFRTFRTNYLPVLRLRYTASTNISVVHGPVFDP